MKYFDLFRPDTRLSDVQSYITDVNIARAEVDSKRGPSRIHGWLISGAFFLGLALVVVSQGAAYAWLIAVAILLLSIFARVLMLSFTAYATYYLFHYGLWVWGVSIPVSVVLTFILDPVWLLLTMLAIVGFTVSGIIALIRLFLSRGSRTPVEEVAEELPLTYAEIVFDGIVHTFLDYFAPKMNFTDAASKPLRSHYDDEQSFGWAMDSYKDEVLQARIQATSEHVLSVEEDSEVEGVVYAQLRTRIGSTDADLLKLTEMLNAALHAYGVEPWNYTAAAGLVGLKVNMTKQPTSLDALTPPVNSAEFFYNNPVVNLDSIPLGETPDRQVWDAPLHHTLCVARTGGGKGSVLQTYIYQLMPLIEQGLVRIWLADPKPAEAIPFRGTSVLYRVAEDDDDIAALIHEFDAAMAAQKQREDIGRSNTATVENPVNILMIDEAASLVDDKAFANIKDDAGRTMIPIWKNITRKGRSLNFFIFLFSQEITADPLGTLPKNIPVKMGGFMESKYEMSKALGLKEEQLDYYPEIIFPIPKSTKQNGMKYAGIFNVEMEEGRVAIRVPYVSDEMIAARIAEFGLDHPPTQTALTGAGISMSKPAVVEALPDPDENPDEWISTFEAPE